MSGYSESATVSQLLKKVEEPTVEMRDVIGSADTSPALDKHDEIIEIGEDFDFDGFQVVRREFFAHLGEPSVTFNSCTVTGVSDRNVSISCKSEITSWVRKSV